MSLTMVGFYLLFITLVSGSENCDDYGCSPEIIEPVEPIRQFEGDMLGLENVENFLRNDSGNEEDRDNALTEETKKWLGGIVYYKISKSFSCLQQCIIHEAIHDMESKTCLNFIEDSQQEDFIEILPDDSLCASYVGKRGAKQQLYLSPKCASSVGNIIHEFMHAIGFFHEQSRKDRNDYIRINFNNIAESNHKQFINHNLGGVTTYNLPYDYESIMHYEPYAFAVDASLKTVVALNGRAVGQREKMSELDVKRINIHYNCTDKLIGCYDTISNCRENKNLATSCRSREFMLKCRRTCNGCSSQKKVQLVSNDIGCHTAADRCSKWISFTGNCASHLTNLKQIVKSICHRTCRNCT